MNYRPSAAAFLGIALGCAALGLETGFSQDSIIAMGHVESDGTLGDFTSPLGAAIVSSRLTEGSYEVTITKTGAFQGLDIEDFVIEAGIKSGSSHDVGLTARVVSVNVGTLVVGIRTQDLEESVSPNNPVPLDRFFYFLIRRAPSGVAGTAGDSRHLLAVGRVEGFTGLQTAFGVGGVSVLTSRESTGHVQIFLEKPGAFAGDDSDDYLVFLTPIVTAVDDKTLRADVKSTILDSSVSFTVHSDDVQANPAGDEGVPVDESFAFAIYRLGGAETAGLPASHLVLMTASVRGSDGVRQNWATSIPGANVISGDFEDGRYFVSITSPGAFAGIAGPRFVPIVTVRGGLVDQIASAQVFSVNDDTLQVTVRTIDVQSSGQSNGVLQDTDFYVVLYDTEANQAPDLGIGVRNAPTTFRTLGVRNATGVGQAALVRPRGTKRQRFFFGSENTGRSVDGLRLVQVGNGKGVATDYFRLTGGRVNVTATVRTGGLVSAAVRPGEFVTFEGGIRFLKSNKRRVKTLRLQAGSGYAPASLDVNQIRAVRR